MKFNPIAADAPFSGGGSNFELRLRQSRTLKALWRVLPHLLTIFLFAGCAATCFVTSEPPGARISVDGKYKGLTPVTIRVPDKFGMGSVYVFTAELEGYTPHTKTFKEFGFDDAHATIPTQVHFAMEGGPAEEFFQQPGETTQILQIWMAQPHPIYMPQPTVIYSHENRETVILKPNGNSGRQFVDDQGRQWQYYRQGNYFTDQNGQIYNYQGGKRWGQ
jgi:hypothetical protein